LSEPFHPGDLCLLLDNRGRRYLIDLAEGGEFQYHAGTLAHRDIIDGPPGSVLRSSAGARLVALRPRLADYILRMHRGPQLVYPKDLGPMLMWGDIGPGMTVLEAGTGSGALTMALLRAVGATGRVVSVERRAEHAEHARNVITRYFGEIPEQLELRVGEVEEAFEGLRPDRLMLDLPEPWRVVAPAADGLADDGVLTAYLPTVPQVQQLHEELRGSRRFTGTTAFEVLQREWIAEGRSVRPAHQMIGHTGFVTVAHKTVMPDGNEPRT
jgi:tRNA (adenine57-N1/adenine58-N1)-methyltransferase